MDTSVGPIESYVPGSSWYDVTQYSTLGTDQEVSVNLASSNLWLVDESQLNFQDSTSPPFVLPGEGKLYESPVTLSAVTLSETQPAIVGGSYTPDSTTTAPTLLTETGGEVAFSGITGAIDARESELNTTSADTSIIIIQMTEPDGFTTVTSSDSPFFSTAYPNADPPASSVTTTDDADPLFPVTTTTTLTTDFPTMLPSDPSTPAPEPVPVPFNASTSLGLVIFTALVAKKLYKRYTASQT